MRRYTSILGLMGIGLIGGTLGCAGSGAEQRSANHGIASQPTYRSSANPARDGWSEPAVTAPIEGQRISRYFPGLIGRSRVSTDPTPKNPALSSAIPASRRPTGTAEIPVRAEATRPKPAVSPRETVAEQVPQILPTAMTVPSSVTSRPVLLSETDAPSDRETKPTNLEQPVKPASPPLPEVHPSPSVVPPTDPIVVEPAATEPKVEEVKAEEPPLPEVHPTENVARHEDRPPTDPIVPAPPLRIRARPELDVEELAPQIAAVVAPDAVEPPAEATATTPPLPPIDPLSPIAAAVTPVANAALFPRSYNLATAEPPRSSTIIVRPRWVPFRRDSAIFNKPLGTTSNAPSETPAWKFWSRPTTATPKPSPQPAAAPATATPAKGWFVTSWLPRLKS